MKNFDHRSLRLIKNKKIVYTAMSKRLSYFKDHISKFVLEKGFVLLNPFNIPYFMLDTVERDICREANNNLLKKADEIWIFGKISDGVLSEIKIAKEIKKPTKFFQEI